MDFLTVLGYFLLVDAILSLAVLGVLFFFKKRLISNLRFVLSRFLDINNIKSSLWAANGDIDSIDARIGYIENSLGEKYETEDEDEYGFDDDMKPVFKAAMDEVFGLKK